MRKLSKKIRNLRVQYCLITKKIVKAALAFLEHAIKKRQPEGCLAGTAGDTE